MKREDYVHRIIPCSVKSADPADIKMNFSPSECTSRGCKVKECRRSTPLHRRWFPTVSAVDYIDLTVSCGALTIHGLPARFFFFVRRGVWLKCNIVFIRDFHSTPNWDCPC